jgi:hypothetical protein
MQGTTFIWFDIFSRRQHCASEQHSSARIAVTNRAVVQAGSIALVLHPFDEPLALKRAWYDPFHLSHFALIMNFLVQVPV